MDDLDLLIESAAVEGQLAAGVSSKLVASRSTLGARAISVLAVKAAKKARSPKWSKEEDAFLKGALGSLTSKEIAEALGRSENAVNVRQVRDLRLPGPSKSKDIFTLNQVTTGLDKDSHAGPLFIKRNVLPEPFMVSGTRIKAVERAKLLAWMLDPLSWVYFDPEKIGRPQCLRCGFRDPEWWEAARKLVLKKKARWKDEWWSIGRVAKYHGVDNCVINKAIHKGELPAVQWNNWWVLKSDALRWHYQPRTWLIINLIRKAIRGEDINWSRRGLGAISRPIYKDQKEEAKASP